MAGLHRVEVMPVASQVVQQWQDVFDAIDDYVFVVDRSHRIVRANQAFREMFDGRSVAGRHCYELLHGRRRPHSCCPAHRVFRSGEPAHVELCETCLDGRWLDLHAYPITAEDGTVEAVLHIVRDISARKRTEQALRQTEGRLRAIFEAARNVAFITTDLAGTKAHIVDFSPGAEQIFGYSKEEIIGKPLAVLHRAEDVRRFPLAIRTLRRSRQPLSEETTLVRKSGETFPAHLTLCPLFDDEGELRWILGVTIDLTERKRAEKELRREKERAEQYLDVVGVVVVAGDREGRVTLVNRKGCEVLGYPKEEILGKDWVETFIPVRFREDVREVLGKVLAGESGPVEYHETPVLTRTGEERLIAWHNNLLTDDAGNPVGILSSGEDITERRRLEQEVLRIGDEERQRIGRDLHDRLAQKLTAIAFMGKLLEHKLKGREPDLAAEVAEITRSVNEVLRETRALVRGLLPPLLEEQGLKAALKELADKAEKVFGVKCRFCCRDGPGLLDGLDGMVATNLYYIAQEAVSNAVKHGKAENISLSLVCSGGRVSLRVTDDGVGLSHKRRRPGCGLHIMKYRARLMGAALSVRGRPDGGTTVTCRLSLPAGAS